jgi:hypothetical protein
VPSARALYSNLDERNYKNLGGMGAYDDEMPGGVGLTVTAENVITSTPIGSSGRFLSGRTRASKRVRSQSH